ncbi:hypothetical protein NEI03_00205 [Brachyspira pilosicoli]|uniref:hypothetical protein n=1 Tax=Brachyspira pilosicoli TaxID=52584 RepID=UPI0025432F6F|nr:hypothetical protein [Brachyspira pilosicoli]WIH85852.1 hypothetical protein NEI03_00205 [Brachyspira pilosicoli]
MSEFKLTYKIGNFEIELKGKEEDFTKTFDNFENSYLPIILKNTNINKAIVEEPVTKKSSKKHKENKENKKNKKNKENKNLNKDCSKVDLGKLGINDEKVKEWKDFYDKVITDKQNAYDIVAILLYWIKKLSNINPPIKVDKNIIYTFLFETGNKIDFQIRDAISNAKREGRAYIRRTDEKGFTITHNGEELVNGFINNK